MSKKKILKKNFKSKDGVERFLPVALVLAMVLAGIGLIGFGQFLFTREPEPEVIITADKEAKEINVKLDEQQVDAMLKSSAPTRGIQSPPYKAKGNPFTP